MGELPGRERLSEKERDLVRERKFDIEWNNRERDPLFIVKERESPHGVV